MKDIFNSQIIYHFNQFNNWLITKKIKTIVCGWVEHDNSFYYILTTNNYRIYVETFYKNDNSDTILNIFENKKNILSYSGNLINCLNKLNEKI